LLILPLEQVPEMARSGRVILQRYRYRYRYGGMADANVFGRADGLTWRLGDKTRTESNLRDWIGRLRPNGSRERGSLGSDAQSIIQPSRRPLPASIDLMVPTVYFADCWGMLTPGFNHLSHTP
jgi:hypothetical protein